MIVYQAAFDANIFCNDESCQYNNSVLFCRSTSEITEFNETYRFITNAKNISDRHSHVISHWWPEVIIYVCLRRHPSHENLSARKRSHSIKNTPLKLQKIHFWIFTALFEGWSLLPCCTLITSFIHNLWIITRLRQSSI